jgi:hypothetical protein
MDWAMYKKTDIPEELKLPVEPQPMPDNIAKGANLPVGRRIL